MFFPSLLLCQKHTNDSVEKNSNQQNTFISSSRSRFLHHMNVTSPFAFRYYYKFIVNGQWKHSTSSPAERDESGNVNNIIMIGETASVRPSVQHQQKVCPLSVFAFWYFYSSMSLFLHKATVLLQPFEGLLNLNFLVFAFCNLYFEPKFLHECGIHMSCVMLRQIFDDKLDGLHSFNIWLIMFIIWLMIITKCLDSLSIYKIQLAMILNVINHDFKCLNL